MKYPPNIYIRRIVSSVIILALLSVIVWGLYSFGTWLWSTISAGSEESGQDQTPAPVKISSCTEKDLDVTLSPSSTKLAVAEGMTVVMHISAKSGAECKLEPDTLDLTLTVGGYPVWTPTKCAAPEDTKLIAKGLEVEREYTWEARIYESCEQVGDLYAEIGMFDLTAKVGEKTADTMKIEVY